MEDSNNSPKPYIKRRKRLDIPFLTPDISIDIRPADPVLENPRQQQKLELSQEQATDAQTRLDSVKNKLQELKSNSIANSERGATTSSVDNAVLHQPSFKQRIPESKALLFNQVARGISSEKAKETALNHERKMVGVHRHIATSKLKGKPKR